MAGHRGRVFWSRHVAAAEGSGLSRAAYCRQNGLDYGTFRRWARRMAAELPARSDAQALVPLRVLARDDDRGDALRLEVGAGAVLVLPRSIDVPWLAALLRELAC